MKSAHLICSCLLLFSIADSTQAGWPSGGSWYYSNYWLSNQPGSDSNVNLPPTISGTPASTATVSKSYTFTPIAADPDSDHLTFSVVNLPVWASFSKRTGTLRGTPSAAGIGLYEDIIISVSDGVSTTSLDPLSIMVNPATVVTGTAELSWVIPTRRTDKSPLSLSDIDGYRIYMGETRDNLSMIVDLNDGTASRYSVIDLASGTYYFAVKVYDVDGNESGFSNIADKTIL